MNEPPTIRKKFHIGIGSVFAGLLLFGGFESLIRVSRDPLARSVIGLLNRFVHSSALKLRETPTQWVLVSAKLAVAVIFIILAVIVGASVWRRTRRPTLTA